MWINLYLISISIWFLSFVGKKIFFETKWVETHAFFASIFIFATFALILITITYGLKH